MDDAQFQQLTANLTELVELTLERGNSSQNEVISSGAIVEFLRSHHKVKQLNVITMLKHCEAELKEQLKDEWNTRIIKAGLSFRRSTNYQL